MADNMLCLGEHPYLRVDSSLNLAFYLDGYLVLSDYVLLSVYKPESNGFDSCNVIG